MSPTDLVEIVIYDAPAPRRGGCDCGCDHGHGGGDACGHEHGGDACGHDDGHCHDHGHQCADPMKKVSMEIQTQAMAVTLEREFPGRIRVEYINVMQDPRGPSLPQTKLLGSLIYPPPLVYLNGKGRFAGALPVERIREEVKAILDAKANPHLKVVS
jgi:hypothetical protein